MPGLRDQDDQDVAQERLKGRRGDRRLAMSPWSCSGVRHEASAGWFMPGRF